MRAAGLVLAGCGLLALGCSQAAAGLDAGGGVTPDSGVGGAPDAGGVALDALVGALASATCDALTRCCDPASVEGYFASYRSNTRLAAMASRFPPTTPLDPVTCPALLEEAFVIVPWGGWVEAARQGSVTYVPDQATLCIQTLTRPRAGTR